MDGPVKIKDNDPLSGGVVLLVEWQNVPEVRQVVSVEQTTVDVKGGKPNLVASPVKVLLRYDARVDGLVAGDDVGDPPEKVGFAPLRGMEGAFLASVSAPAEAGKAYHWYLQRLGAFIDNDNVQLIFGREATPEESGMIDTTFPGWLEKMKELTERERKT